MACLAYSRNDIASSNIANSLRRVMGFGEPRRAGGDVIWEEGHIRMVGIDESLLESPRLQDYADGDVLMFLSKHSSARGIASYTVHAEGNWSDDAPLGGKAHSLSVAAPREMLATLSAIEGINVEGVATTYEATHHGPLVDVPSFFVELGGNDSTVANLALAEKLADAIYKSLEGGETSFNEVAIGIGGMHYPNKFTKLALQGKYAFSHIMPKYYTGNTDMLGSAIERSSIRAEKAVIEWKSIKAGERNNIIGKLAELGIDYERV